MCTPVRFEVTRGRVVAPLLLDGRRGLGYTAKVVSFFTDARLSYIPPCSAELYMGKIALILIHLVALARKYKCNHSSFSDCGKDLVEFVSNIHWTYGIDPRLPFLWRLDRHPYGHGQDASLLRLSNRENGLFFNLRSALQVTPAWKLRKSCTALLYVVL